MELEDNNEANQYILQLNELNGGINTLLNEFAKMYSIVKMNPDNQEYQQQFQNTMNGLSEISSALFTMSNNVQVNINGVNQKLMEIYASIRIEKDKNKELKRQLGIVKNESNASTELISDYKSIYNNKYLRNWSLLLSSLLCVTLIHKIYK